MSDFERFLIARDDELEQTAYTLLWHMLNPGADIKNVIYAWGEFDMAQIGPLLESAEDILSQSGIPVCHPYYGENETPCYLTGDCEFSACPMKDEE